MPMMGQGMHDTMGQQTKQGDGGARYGPRYDAWQHGPRDDAGGMGPGVMRGGMAALFGSRVTMMNLSAEEVRGYLGAQLDRLDNKRLKVGDIKADDGTITANIVTVDNSHVQRLKVDRHTGAIEYQN